MTVNDTVPTNPPEREPVHYVPVGASASVCGVALVDIPPFHALDADSATCPACLDVLDRANSPLAVQRLDVAPDAGRAEIAQAERATDWAAMSDDELVDRLRESAAAHEPVFKRHLLMANGTARCGEARPTRTTRVEAEVQCPGCLAAMQAERDELTVDDIRDYRAAVGLPPAPAPERRTVGLEVLTDELRAVANKGIAAEFAKYDRKPELLPPEARAAVVVRRDGQLHDVTDVDTDVPHPTGADSLAWLMRQAQGRARNLDAELLMPGADVLGALSGDIWAGFTAPVESRWGLVQPGWWVSVETLDRDADPDVEWALVDDRAECHDPICLVRGDSPPWACAVATVQGRGVQHLDAFRSVYVRIPASGEVQR